MILAELAITNYKHYVGEYRIEPPAQGVVAVIGANGVGKTTLFEAIEWCLYNPREIENAEVAPRGGVGGTKVRVTIEDPRDGVRYVIERTLRRNVANGEIYREDLPEAPIVQGSRQVSTYVASKLIGLSHRAFVSTFFTRQKELSFFGGLRETERRREVARLLGLETIRVAQEEIAQDRTRARIESDALSIQYNQTIAERDFAAELIEAEASIVASEEAAAAAEARMTAAEAAFTFAREQLARWQALERQESKLRHDLATVAGDERAALARRSAADESLARLGASARQRDSLLPLASRLDELRTTAAKLAADRQRFDQVRQLEADQDRADRQYAEALAEMRSAIDATTDAADNPDTWQWSDDDNRDPPVAAQRRLETIAALDLEAARTTATQLDLAWHAVKEHSEFGARASRYERALAALRSDRESLLAENDPDLQLSRIDAERQSTRERAQAANIRAQNAVSERGRLRQLVAALEAERFEDRCPTCGRAFSDREAALVLTTLTNRITELDEVEKEAISDQRAASVNIERLDNDRRVVAKRAEEIAHLSGRIEEGDKTVVSAWRDVEASHQRLLDALDPLGIDSEPTEADVAAANEQLGRFDRLNRIVPVLKRARHDALRASGERRQAETALDALGLVSYSPEMHGEIEQELDAARAAVATIAQIDTDLAQRPEREADRASADADLAAIAERRAALEAERVTLGFNPEALAGAQQAEAAALADQQATKDEQHAAAQSLRDARRQRDTIVGERARLEEVARRADTRRREADELERMYGEFNRFDQFVADRVAPAMAEQAGELLGAVTEGKYDRVVFDDNYGLHVYDGDEKFPIAEFSGGERDVIALCARLALSRLIAAQATHPPMFLVLDEVFGSLDQERRAHVLETLGTLANSSDAFRQLFIISHVDEIRQSHIFDEVWKISDVDGASRFENLTATGGFEDA